ncbi:MAG: DNA polymerase III subunit delta [Pirellulales bacterium]
MTVAGSTSALDIIVAPDDWEFGAPSLVVVHGDEPFLVYQVLDLLRGRLCPDEADRAWAWREFDGGEPLDPRDVFDEAATIPMFATATRAAVVRQADAFVTASRERLEALAGTDRGRRGLVILEVKSFPATTRLAKAVATHGLVIDATIPAKADLAGWVRTWARTRHGITLAAATSQRLLERLGGNLGQIDQALARLAAAVDPAKKAVAIPPEAVDDFAGSPQERTAWGMIDAAGGGDTKRALRELADLIDAGENPIGIAAQIASVLRRLSTAARLLALPAGAGRPAGVEQALREAGVAAWPKALAQAKESLAQLGPRRARRLPVWLLDLDLSLKGEASRGLRARLALERLFCKMSRGGATRAPRPALRMPGTLS